MKVFIVLKWSDFKNGGNEANVLGIYNNVYTAYNTAKVTAEKGSFDLEWELNEIQNGYQITDGEDYILFEVKESDYSPN